MDQVGPLLMPPGLIIDTDCLLAYAAGTSTEVGRNIADCAVQGESVLVPVLCLAEAYRQVDRDSLGLLDIVQTLENVTVTPVEPDMASFLGGFTNTMGRLDLAQLVITAAEHMLVSVMTSERDRITQVLAKGWPIIDL